MHIEAGVKWSKTYYCVLINYYTGIDVLDPDNPDDEDNLSQKARQVYESRQCQGIS